VMRLVAGCNPAPMSEKGAIDPLWATDGSIGGASIRTTSRHRLNLVVGINWND
jgi:hypothetical protein